MNWYCLQVHTSHEQRVAARLGDQKVESYWPSRALTIKHANRRETVRRSLFPGYLFARFRGTPLIIANPHVLRVLQSDGEAAVIPDAIVASVRTMEQSPSVVVAQGSALSPAQLAECPEVHIRCGPLTGVVGRVVRQGKHDRVVVSVPMIGKSVSVEVDIEWLEMKKAA
jgi:transcription antitermination factor NusG